MGYLCESRVVGKGGLVIHSCRTGDWQLGGEEGTTNRFLVRMVRGTGWGRRLKLSNPSTYFFSIFVVHIRYPPQPPPPPNVPNFLYTNKAWHDISGKFVLGGGDSRVWLIFSQYIPRLGCRWCCGLRPRVKGQERDLKVFLWPWLYCRSRSCRPVPSGMFQKELESAHTGASSSAACTLAPWPRVSDAMMTMIHFV